MTVRSTWSGDLDAGLEADEDGWTSRDFLYENTDGNQRFLAPRNGAKFGVFSQIKHLLPQILDGLGVGSEFLITNSGSEHNFGTIYLKDSAGESTPWSVAGSLVDAIAYSLPAGGALRVISDGLGELKVGYAVIVPDDDYEFITGAITYTLGTSEASALAGSPGDASHVFVERNATVDTGIAVVNTGLDDSAIDIALVEGEIGIIHEIRELELPRGAHIALFIDELFDTIPEEFLGTVHLRSSGGEFAVIALRQQASDGSVGLVPAAASAISFTEVVIF